MVIRVLFVVLRVLFLLPANFHGNNVDYDPYGNDRKSNVTNRYSTDKDDVCE
jgi:hypothetical protein